MPKTTAKPDKGIKTKICSIGSISFESGETLKDAKLAYTDIGNPSGPVILIEHALSGHQLVAGKPAVESIVLGEEGWWESMVGPGKAIDTNIYRVICPNILGGCAGSTGPASINPETGKPYGSTFPDMSMTDTVTAQRALIKKLGITKLSVMGGSMGGMQSLIWAREYPEMIESAIIIAATPYLSEYAISLDIGAMHFIDSDKNWNNGDYYENKDWPVDGLSLARQHGFKYYTPLEPKAREYLNEKKSIHNPTPAQIEETVAAYLKIQGANFTKRFDAGTAYVIHRAVRKWNLVKTYGSLEEAFSPITAPCFFLSFDSDTFYTPEESEMMHQALLSAGKKSQHTTFSSPFGHDSFLIEEVIENSMTPVIRDFLL